MFLFIHIFANGFASMPKEDNGDREDSVVNTRARDRVAEILREMEARHSVRKSASDDTVVKLEEGDNRFHTAHKSRPQFENDYDYDYDDPKSGLGLRSWYFDPRPASYDYEYDDPKSGSGVEYDYGYDYDLTTATA
jgi:hypothetical protein